MTSTVSGNRVFDEINLSSKVFWSSTAAEREKSYAVLRECRPVSWHRPVEASGLMSVPDDRGFWAVTKHADIIEVSRRSDVFLSSQGVHLEPIAEDLREASLSFLGMDAPKHGKIRGLVSSAFTPKQVKRIEDQIRTNARLIVQELAAAGSGADFVRHGASKLPLRTFADMVGVPEEERQKVAEAADALVSWGDPDFLQGRDALSVVVESHAYLHQVAFNTAEARRSAPATDLMTALVQAEVDGERLTNEEIAAFFILISVAGNDTTRQTTSLALKALTDNPEQRAWLMDDFENRIGTAVEEFIRWASPVMTFSRVAATDYELNGQHISTGDRVVMFYASGNWDTDVFDHPNTFDLSRTPNPHVSFGGGGAHFCLGNQVAKAQLRAIFRELLSRLPDIEAGEPDFLIGNFIHAVRAMPCTFSA